MMDEALKKLLSAGKPTWRGPKLGDWVSPEPHSPLPLYLRGEHQRAGACDPQQDTVESSALAA